MSERTAFTTIESGTGGILVVGGLLLVGGGSFLGVASYALIIFGVLALLQAVAVGLHLVDVPAEGSPRAKDRHR